MRLRMFCGPNGSGKSTMIKAIRQRIPLGVYLNADDIEKELSDTGQISLAKFLPDFSLDTDDRFKLAMQDSRLLDKGTELSSLGKFKLHEGIAYWEGGGLSSYQAAFVTEFLREELRKQKVSFSFETVMSHPSKASFLADSKQAGYRTYVYFICTKSPAINLARVSNRVKKGGHAVPDEKVISRYWRSLGLLESAVKSAYRAFIFDNSADSFELVLETSNYGKHYTLHRDLPNWAMVYGLKPLLGS